MRGLLCSVLDGNLARQDTCTVQRGRWEVNTANLCFRAPLTGSSTYMHDQQWQAKHPGMFCTWMEGMDAVHQCAGNTHTHTSKMGPFSTFFLFLSLCLNLNSFNNSSSHFCTFRWTNYVNLLSRKFVLNGKMVQVKWFSFPCPSSSQAFPNNSWTVWVCGVFYSWNI